ncbi:MAG: hypothetical protein AB8H80_08925 [Planctomycetota bacterium]
MHTRSALPPTALAAAIFAGIFAGIFTATAPRALAQEASSAATQSATAVAKTTKFVLPAGEISIKDFVQCCSDYLGISVLMNQNECSGTQALRMPRAVETDHKGCEELLHAMLFRSGFGLTPLNDGLKLYEAILLSGTRGREVQMRAKRKTPTEILAQPNIFTMVMTSVELKHINAQLANNALRPFFASNGHSSTSLSIGNVGNRSNLILMGWQPQVAHALHMIQECDIPGQNTGKEAELSTRIERLEARLARLEKLLGDTKGK